MKNSTKRVSSCVCYCGFGQKCILWDMERAFKAGKSFVHRVVQVNTLKPANGNDDEDNGALPGDSWGVLALANARFNIHDLVLRLASALSSFRFRFFLFTNRWGSEQVHGLPGWKCGPRTYRLNVLMSEICQSCVVYCFYDCECVILWLGF